jgi:hypothetical protein
MFLDFVPPVIIRRGYHLRSINEKHISIFCQGTHFGFDSFLGFDGMWSKSQKLLSDQTPIHSRVTRLSFTIPNVKETAPGPYELTKNGFVFPYVSGKALMNLQIGDGSIAVVFKWYRQKVGWTTCLSTLITMRPARRTQKDIQPLILRIYQKFQPRPGLAAPSPVYATRGIELGV